MFLTILGLTFFGNTFFETWASSDRSWPFVLGNCRRPLTIWIETGTLSTYYFVIMNSKKMCFICPGLRFMNKIWIKSEECRRRTRLWGSFLPVAPSRVVDFPTTRFFDLRPQTLLPQVHDVTGVQGLFQVSKSTPRKSVQIIPFLPANPAGPSAAYSQPLVHRNLLADAFVHWPVPGVFSASTGCAPCLLAQCDVASQIVYTAVWNRRHN